MPQVERTGEIDDDGQGVFDHPVGGVTLAQGVTCLADRRRQVELRVGVWVGQRQRGGQLDRHP
jgi:hypothetical protein